LGFNCWVGVSDVCNRPAKYLDVNLTSGVISDYTIPPDWLRLHIGGRGVAGRLLLSELSGEEDPLGEENILVFATGPFQGTGLAGAGRHLVMTISPKTRRVGDSYAGGYFGFELARTGWDGIVIRGKASAPTILAITEIGGRLLPAEELWGTGTGHAESKLRDAFPGSRVSSIGVAGENLVQAACIINDRSRAAGRLGFGAVMGSKLLKAVIVKGARPRPLFDRERFKQEAAEYVKLFNTPSMHEFGRYGTSRFVYPLSEIGILPTRNFLEGTFSGAEDIDGRAMAQTILMGRETCAGCPIRCKRQVQTSYGGVDVLPDFGGPEYETMAAFGSLCLNDNLDSIALANQLCNDYGIDTISAGVACATVMEASERGLIDDRYDWGDPQVITSLIEAIAHREGIGDLLATGLDAFAREVGADFAMTIKGVEVPMHDPRGKKGLAISYATSYRGATHMEGVHDNALECESPAPELGVDQPYERLSFSGKPAVAKLFEDLWSFGNSLILCAFTSRGVGSEYKYIQIRSLLEAATGVSLTADEMLAVGERNYCLMQMHAARSKVRNTPALPDRLHEPLPSGGSAGCRIDREELCAAVEEYYRKRGYEGRFPTDKKLSELGLDDLRGLVG